MLREFVQLVSENVDAGYSRGMELFMESLEVDLKKDAIINESGLPAIIGHLFQEAGIEVSEDDEMLTEDQIAELLKDDESEE